MNTLETLSIFFLLKIEIPMKNIKTPIQCIYIYIYIYIIHPHTQIYIRLF